MTRLQKKLIIDAPVEEVWQVLADFGNPSNWAPTIVSSNITTSHSHGLDAERICNMVDGRKIHERVVEWEDGSHLSYIMQTGLGPMKSARLTWAVESVGGKTRASITFDFDMKFGPLGALMEIMMIRRMIRKEMGLSISGLQHHIETGEQVTLETFKSVPVAV